MATQEQFTEQLARIDAATTAIAAELNDLKDQIHNLGLSAEVEDSILEKLSSAASKLEGIGAA